MSLYVGGVVKVETPQVWHLPERLHQASHGFARPLEKPRSHGNLFNAIAGPEGLQGILQNDFRLTSSSINNDRILYSTVRTSGPRPSAL